MTLVQLFDARERSRRPPHLENRIIPIYMREMEHRANTELATQSHTKVDKFPPASAELSETSSTLLHASCAICAPRAGAIGSPRTRIREIKRP